MQQVVNTSLMSQNHRGRCARRSLPCQAAAPSRLPQNKRPQLSCTRTCTSRQLQPASVICHSTIDRERSNCSLFTCSILHDSSDSSSSSSSKAGSSSKVGLPVFDSLILSNDDDCSLPTFGIIDSSSSSSSSSEAGSSPEPGMPASDVLTLLDVKWSHENVMSSAAEGAEAAGITASTLAKRPFGWLAALFKENSSPTSAAAPATAEPIANSSSSSSSGSPRIAAYHGSTTADEPQPTTLPAPGTGTMPAATTAVPIAEPAAAAAIATMPRAAAAAAAAAADEAVAELMSPEDEAAADALNAETFEEPLSQPGQLQWLLSLASWWWWWCVQYQVLGWIVHVRGFDDATRRSIAAEAAAKRAAQAELWRWGSPTGLKVKQQRLCCRLQYMALALDTRSLGAGSRDSKSLEKIHWQTFRDDKCLANKALASRPELCFDRRARGIWPHVPADILETSWEERHTDQMRQAGRTNRVDAALQAMTPAARTNWFRSYAQQHVTDEADVPSFNHQWQQLQQQPAWMRAVEDIKNKVKASGLAWSAGLDVECSEQWPAGLTGCPCRNCKANRWSLF